MQTFVINSQSVEFEIIEDTVFTNSLHVSKVFEKRHSHLLETIRKYPSNFRLNEYKDKIGRTLPKYEIIRDGFSMLVMGFTGKKPT